MPYRSDCVIKMIFIENIACLIYIHKISEGAYNRKVINSTPPIHFLHIFVLSYSIQIFYFPR